MPGRGSVGAVGVRLSVWAGSVIGGERLEAYFLGVSGKLPGEAQAGCHLGSHDYGYVRQQRIRGHVREPEEKLRDEAG